MPSTVQVTVKAANGAVADFRVSVEEGWNVQRLKNHLYRHYPTHPPVTSQKLIHGGRLLIDQETIHELFPEPGEHPVVVHLVAYQRSVSVPILHTNSQSESQLSPGTHTEQASRRSSQPQVRPQPTQTPQQSPPPPSHPPSPWVRYRPPQHVQQQGQSPAIHNLPMMGGPALAAGGAYAFPQFYMSPFGAAYATQMAWYYNYYGRPPPGAPVVPEGPQGIGRADDVDLGVPQEAGVNNEEDQVEEVAMNAGGLGMMAGGGMRRERDIVDYIYMLMMAAFLAAVAYLTGSMGRLLIFAAGIIFMLLNQAGWFSLQRRRQVRELEDPLAAHGRQHQPEGGGEERAEDGGNEAEDEATDQPTPMMVPPVPQAPQRPGVLATLCVFITSFFTSLIPQQRPELMMN